MFIQVYTRIYIHFLGQYVDLIIQDSNSMRKKSRGKRCVSLNTHLTHRDDWKNRNLSVICPATSKVLKTQRHVTVLPPHC